MVGTMKHSKFNPLVTLNYSDILFHTFIDRAQS
jgi:hypothetical protein